MDELLEALDNVTPSKLENNSDTWRRIANQDEFPELGLSGTELKRFLAEWKINNPYNLAN